MMLTLYKVTGSTKKIERFWKSVSRHTVPWNSYELTEFRLVPFLTFTPTFPAAETMVPWRRRRETSSSSQISYAPVSALTIWYF